MRIGIVIARIGGVDAVSLEAEKWIEVLEEMGHKVFVVSGEFLEWNMNDDRDTLIPEMSYNSPSAQWDQENAFFQHSEPPDELLYHIDNYANIISKCLSNWIEKVKPDLLIIENATALPTHLALGHGLKKTLEKHPIPSITHDHNFVWEYPERFISPFEGVNKLIDETFPLRLPHSFHAVLNTHAQTILQEKFQRKSVVTPNVMDFGKPFGLVSDYNNSLRTELGVEANDYLLFQATSIVRRKRIDTAIELIRQLDNPRIKLIITGSAASDDKSLYFNELLHMIRKYKLDDKVLFAAHKINNIGQLSGPGITYSLSDAYAQARCCTYFSDYEGFGNTFLQSVMARRPIFVNNYKPVYWPDIGSKGFRTVMLEENRLTDNAIAEMRNIILDDDLNAEIAAHNYKLGQEHFSYDTLKTKFEELFRIIF